jgi:HPt (histidine-containing phosphotransfer) domain-containing protein
MKDQSGKPAQQHLTAEVDAELADLMPQYLSNRWVDLREMRRCLADERYSEIVAITHRIRGTAASYGFLGLGDIADALQQAARDGDGGAIECRLDDYDLYMRTVIIRYV